MGALLSVVLPLIGWEEEPFVKTYAGPVALDSEKWQEFKLSEIENISHDVRRFRFALQSPQHILGLPIGQHITFKYVDAEGKEVMRSYTPVSSDHEIGYVDFVIKVYFKDVHPKFPAGGKMSQYVNNLKVGDAVLMKGPKGALEYHDMSKRGDQNGGFFTITKFRQEPIEKKILNLGMLAGGTGITPMMQVVRAAVKNHAKDKINFWLIYANQTEEDILLRSELDALARSTEIDFRVHYTLDRPPANGWAGSEGFITADMCRDHLPPCHLPNVMIFMCGPSPMIKFACEPALKELGFEETQCYTF